MTKFRSLGVAAVFLAGCGLGGASARFVVPPANAQQAAALTKWEYTCFEERDSDVVQPMIQKAGAQGWELAGIRATGESLGKYAIWCFKRPKV